MADDHDSAIFTEPSAGLRHRSTAGAQSMEGDVTPTFTASTITRARRDSCQTATGSPDTARTLTQHVSPDAPARVRRGDPEQRDTNSLGNDQTSGEEAGLHQRRTSVASSVDEDDYVAELLRPGHQAIAMPAEKTIREETAGEGAAAGPEAAREPEDASMCRICFGGPDDELGKLFSPCKCTGTSRFVHQSCLETWRKASRNRRSFYECDLCRYQYKFRRTTAARLVTSRITVTLLTSWIFLFLVFLSGFLANTLMSVVEARNSVLSDSLFNDFFVADHILLGEGVREAVTFVGHQLEESRWAAGREEAIRRALHTDKLDHSAGAGDNRNGDTAYRYVKPTSGDKVRGTAQQAEFEAPLLFRTIMHFTKGSALIGILSVFYTYIAATFVSPLGRTLFRAIRPVGTRRRNDNSTSMSQIVIVILVVLGIVRSIRQVYRGVQWLTKVVLSRVEDLVLEI
ncbi:hypothetical protein JCM11641_007544 [Rhodosporidiobolus odoratus]